MYLGKHIGNINKIEPLSSLIIECICKYEYSSNFIIIVFDGYFNNDVADLKELFFGECKE